MKKAIKKIMVSTFAFLMMLNSISSIPASACTIVIRDPSRDALYDGKYDEEKLIKYENGKIYLEYMLDPDNTVYPLKTYTSFHFCYLIRTTDDVSDLAKNDDIYLYSFEKGEWLNEQNTTTSWIWNNYKDAISNNNYEITNENLYLYTGIRDVYSEAKCLSEKEREDEVHNLCETYNISEIIDIDQHYDSKGSFYNGINIGIPADTEMTDELKEEIISYLPEYSLGWNISSGMWVTTDITELEFDGIGKVNMYHIGYTSDMEYIKNEDGTISWVHTASDCPRKKMEGLSALEYANLLYNIDEIIYSSPYAEYLALAITSYTITDITNNNSIEDVTEESTEYTTKISEKKYYFR